jgi:hypothetical protein
VTRLRRIRKAALLVVPTSLVAALLLTARAGAQEGGGLRPGSAFAGMTDRHARSVALFTEAGKVLTHPRCMNCHPATARPLQGDDRHPHVPKVEGGPAGFGVPGLTCAACHRERNLALAGTTMRSTPGNPGWRLAPHGMAWEGKTLGQICEQLKDPTRNGGRTLAALQEHMAHDELVAWVDRDGGGVFVSPRPGADVASIVASIRADRRRRDRRRRESCDSTKPCRA